MPAIPRTTQNRTLDTVIVAWMNAAALVRAMDQATRAWHETAHPTEPLAELPAESPDRLHPIHPENTAGLDHVLALHRANFDLWHLEDSARDPAATSRQIATVKRSIDRVNQGRNDRAEAIDALLMGALNAKGLPVETAPLHSETPGQMLDRLSILSLKQFHTAEESRRASAGPAHRERNLQRLPILQQQIADLAGCLDDLWQAILRGERRFKLYRQFKMYNDPDLNPAIYRRALPR